MRNVKFVLLFLFIFGVSLTSYNQSISAFAGGAENQFSCFLGGVYKKDIDRCVSIFRESQTQEKSLALDGKDVREIKVLSMYTVKKGDSCIKITKLSLKECIRLGKDFGRSSLVFVALDGKQTIDVPLYIGEQIAFVRYTKDGNTRVTYILSK